ncbi:ATP-grasp domain-containing protein [Marinobacter sp. SS21]|uniref:ATP-grasp domain-containing protein n=1 Tax=Marinobacter sp. SS21 TaxID=2979460 RepID=UPI00232D51F3|nr:hypothetical protein [Marinobacter sp. SS21]MDC0661662.1 hypothetical protein [Marinobacter sp. SS21]
MRPELVVLTHVVTEAVNLGFLPAARQLGLTVTILTDQPEEHHRHFSAPGMPAYPDEIVGCDVFNPIAVIELLEQRGRPAALFSNSDHLQAVTAMAADYFSLPGKDWRVCYRAKNKAAMRSWSRQVGVAAPWAQVISDQGALEAAMAQAPFPVVAKPREGVASMDVCLLSSRDALRRHVEAFWQRCPGQPLLLEAYMQGDLFTLETLGDGENFVVLGGFRVELSPPPDFVEIRAQWVPAGDAEQLAEMVRQIRDFGVQFGACHSEFVLTEDGPRLIEINYRSVGDGRELLLDRLFPFPLFETILRLHLGEPLPELTVERGHALIEYLVASREGRISQAPDGFTRPLGQGELSFHPLRQAGERIVLSRSNKDYLGVIKAYGADLETLHERVGEQARALLPAWEIGS